MKDSPDQIYLNVSVSDTGVGIKPEDMKRLFKAFERIEESKNRNVEGTGLGMSIAQSFLNMMGSHIEVESEYGKGSTFSFKLVQGVKDWNPIGDYEETFRRAVSERKKYRERFTAPDARLLVVDDTPVNLSVFENLLKRTKVQIDTATSGDEGISLYRHRQYDVVFLDHMMPDKDGIETLQEMRKIPGSVNVKTPIVCLTANAISGVRETYIKAGFNDYITKPIDPDRLEALLLQYIPEDKIAPASEDEEEEDCLIPDFIMNLEELDVKTGITHCGSQDSYIATLEMYLEAAERNAQEIEKYWKEKDIKNTTVKIHALKSTSRIIGAVNLGDFAARLEKAGETGDIETLEREIGALLTQYRNLVKELEPLEDAKNDAEDERPPISDKDIKKAYEDLAGLCNAFDYDGVIGIMKSLEEYRFPENEADKFESLKRAVDNFDYDLIPEILSGKEKEAT